MALLPEKSDFDEQTTATLIRDAEPQKEEGVGSFGLRFERLRNAVLSHKPIFKEIIEKCGDKSLYSYATDYLDVNTNKAIRDRHPEFFSVFHPEVERLLGRDVADKAVAQLEKHYFVSTADHHGPIGHPFFLNSNLLTSIPYCDLHDSSLRQVIVLACGSISQNNSSFPRGLVFTSHTKSGEVKTQRLPFFASQWRLCPVYNFRSYTTEDTARVFALLDEMERAGEIRAPEKLKIETLLKEVYLDPEVMNAELYSEQVTKTNFSLWKRFFSEGPGQDYPNLIYLELETLVRKLLLAYHLSSSTVIHKMLFDPDYHRLVDTYFEGIQGAFSEKEKWGTYFFWGLPKGAKYRLQMWRRGDELVSDDGAFRVALTPEKIAEALEKRELIPSLMLSYILVSFYYGIKCLGGFSQVNYLTFMKNAYIKMLADMGEYRSIEICARSQTKELGADINVAFLGGPKGEMVPATGIDLILYGHGKTWQHLVDQTRQITLREAIDPTMPEFYRYIYQESKRDPDLARITAEEITKHIELDKKIVPCVTIRGDYE